MPANLAQDAHVTIASGIVLVIFLVNRLHLLAAVYPFTHYDDSAGCRLRIDDAGTGEFVANDATYQRRGRPSISTAVPAPCSHPPACTVLAANKKGIAISSFVMVLLLI